MTCKKLKRQTPFWLVYGQESLIPMDYIFSSLIVDEITDMTDVHVLKEILSQLMQLEQEHFFAGFHQNVENKYKKHGMIDTLRENTLRLEDLFLCMTRNFSSIQES